MYAFLPPLPLLLSVPSVVLTPIYLHLYFLKYLTLAPEPFAIVR